VRVKASVVDRTTEVDAPPDLLRALRAERALGGFQAIPLGERAFLLRKLEQAAKPATREKRVQDIVEAVHRRRERS
jgi:uncharacterized protein YdeI (YjbR/CyaY-like superfamily)